MLKLSNPIKFTQDEQSVIDEVFATGKSGPEMWKANSVRDIKHRISEHTLIEQGCRCAYCETLLVQGTTAIEHFAPKGKNRNFTFEPLNLVSACGRCNSTSIKGEKDTINLPKNNKYDKNTFSIVHPRLDDPDNEIKFTNATRTVFDKAQCSQKGLDTIEFFHWDDADAVISRLINSNRSIFSIDLQKYAALVSTYK